MTLSLLTDFTVFGTNPDSSDWLYIPLFMTWCGPLTVSVSDELFLFHTDWAQKLLIINFSKFFLFSSLATNIPSSFLIHCSPIIFWLTMTILFGIIKSSYFWFFLQMNLSFFLSFTIGPVNGLLAFFFGSRYFYLFVFPYFHFFQSWSFFTNFVINIIIPPPCFSSMTWWISPRHWSTGLVSSGASLTSWGEGASLALVGDPSSDGVTIKMPFGVDVLHQPASHPIFFYWVG